ncbi:MAG: hypothetical protein ABFD90_15925 [Phycisphaerales bacterium]
MTIWGKSESLCQKAQEYYYELLCHNGAAVPEAITRHVEGCSFCREQIRQLQEALAEAANRPDSSQGPRNNEAIEALSRHFEFLDEPVHCSQVKPFLPELLISSRQIRIPTPITVHVENCPQCSRDLASICEMVLRVDQLNRLSLFYRQVGGHDLSHCPAARPVAAGLAAFSLDGADSQTLNHVSLCPECQTWLYRQRAQTMTDRCVPKARTGVLACSEVSTADVFDFVVPFGLDAATVARTSGRRDAVATHVRACPQCLEKVQSLHRTLYAVVERADSAVCTVCRTEKDAAEACEQTQADAYRYPIHVEVLRQEPARAGSARWKAVPRSRIALAAAVVLVAGLLAINPLSTATGMNVEKLRKAVGQMPNVRITNSREDNSAPFFEMWFATDRQIVATKVGEERIVYECGKRRKTVYTPGSPPRPGSLRQEESDSCTEFMTWAFMEIFTGVSSEKDSLSEVEHVASGRPGEYWSAYELTQKNRDSEGAPFVRRWKVHFDPIRRLPMRVEYSRQFSSEPSTTEVRVTEFTYLTQSAMDGEITALTSAE